MENPLLASIVRRIQQSGGWMGFDEFMAMALYEPGLGYYAGGRAEPFGASGDFITAPMSGTWLAWAINRWARPMAGPSGLNILEFGGGTGELAEKILLAAALPAASAAGVRHDGLDGATTIDYQMLEVSGFLRAAQMSRTQGLGKIRWIDRLPEGFCGLVLANEVLDALPVKRFEWHEGHRVLEWGVSESDGLLNWAAREAADPLAQIVKARACAAEQRGLPWADGFRGEWSPMLGPWIKAVADSMDQGAVLLFDYGFAQSELDHPGRTSGTLCAHARHQRLDDDEALISDPGHRDLTAHVNFSELADAAEKAGLKASGFVTQGRFLLNMGILDHARECLERASDPIERARLAQSLQTLLLESEMGEVFKVMLLTKNMPPLALGELLCAGFEEGDRTEQLAVDRGF